MIMRSFILKEQITDIEYLPFTQFGYLEKDRKAVFDIFCKNKKKVNGLL
jgi:hypothetical protein